MRNYNYKTVKIKGKFRNPVDINHMDQVINESAQKGWELVSTAPLANSIWDHGKTNGMLLTFRQEQDR